MVGKSAIGNSQSVPRDSPAGLFENGVYFPQVGMTVQFFHNLGNAPAFFRPFPFEFSDIPTECSSGLWRKF
jgi:hypothetical protein